MMARPLGAFPPSRRHPSAIITRGGWGLRARHKREAWRRLPNLARVSFPAERKCAAARRSIRPPLSRRRAPTPPLLSFGVPRLTDETILGTTSGRTSPEPRVSQHSSRCRHRTRDAHAPSTAGRRGSLSARGGPLRGCRPVCQLSRRWGIYTPRRARSPAEERGGRPRPHRPTTPSAISSHTHTRTQHHQQLHGQDTAEHADADLLEPILCDAAVQ